MSILGSQQQPTRVEGIEGTLVEFTMVRVPDGTITLGSKRIPVKGLWVAQTETTWDLFDIWAFRLDQSHEEQATGVDAESRPSQPYGAPDRGFGHHGYAALGISHHAAKTFCEWLAKKTGKPYRVPTEAEWQYACLAGGAAPEELDPVAWTWENGDDAAHPVAAKAPNAWGLHDMLGNVREWAEALDGTPVAVGGSYVDKNEAITPDARWIPSPKWNERDPQNPKSLWWLSDGPFMGMRVVYTE